MTRSHPLPGQWARLNADLSCGLRRGAWYRVVRLTPDEAVLQVPRREQVRVPRHYVETLSNRPRHWTVVPRLLRDRKSTRLNSSHLGISYAVFCLKKKN